MHGRGLKDRQDDPATTVPSHAGRGFNHDQCHCGGFTNHQNRESLRFDSQRPRKHESYSLVRSCCLMQGLPSPCSDTFNYFGLLSDLEFTFVTWEASLCASITCMGIVLPPPGRGIGTHVDKLKASECYAV